MGARPDQKARCHDLEAASTASRILVERDPDRDPSFLLDQSSPKASGNPDRPDRMYARFEQVMLGGQPLAAMLYQFGFTRLRRANPVEHYTAMLTHRFSPVRVSAAIALGDTADLAALTPLTTALVDRSASVRKHAADAVCRLRHAGAAAHMPHHLVHQKLVECLDDSKRDVRIAAARALGSLDEEETLKRHRVQLSAVFWRHRRDIDQVLTGIIHPLDKHGRETNQHRS